MQELEPARARLNEVFIRSSGESLCKRDEELYDASSTLAKIRNSKRLLVGKCDTKRFFGRVLLNVFDRMIQNNGLQDSPYSKRNLNSPRGAERHSFLT